MSQEGKVTLANDDDADVIIMATIIRTVELRIVLLVRLAKRQGCSRVVLVMFMVEMA